ncbi:Polyadenylate-binding protein-interacting protein [Thalictrum thalictroides]|uniref:Polyadenylate-binding protein-interacting protein n=1 Tax=Thalictrum thalictroides TaxID=46969 RepID=A0A7J6X7C9_THATH|nr:Polyadenylate-binding protein-interacting protein [Thalictrum thalictroides]
MDVRKSSLNPYASSYVPLAKRGKENESKPVQMTPGDSIGHDKIAFTKHPESYTRETVQNLDEETEIDLANLGATFPGVSSQSISDVYYANGCDVEASFDMLKELEYPAEFSQCLPDTLDIGDVADFGSSTEGTSVKPKVIIGEASGSSSGVSKFVQ